MHRRCLRTHLRHQRACWPNLPQRSLDRHSNDCLGRNNGQPLTQAADIIPAPTVGRPPAPPTRLSSIPQTAVWTGSEMIVWGGCGDPTRSEHRREIQSHTGSWTRTTTSNAPSGREGHTAVWTGSEMIIWGGGSCTSTLAGNTIPARIVGRPPAPRARLWPELHTAVWTGSEMIIWGGEGLAAI